MKKIDTTPIHDLYSGNPVYQLKPIKNRSGFQFVYKKENITTLAYLILAASALFIGLSDDGSIWAIVIIGVIALGIHFIMGQFKNQILIFDTKKSEFYKLNKKSQERSEEIAFSTIEAIQILHYIEESSNSNDDDGIDTYTYINAYELNLVLPHKRVNLVAHSNYKHIKKDARKLARLLDIEIIESKSNSYH